MKTYFKKLDFILPPIDMSRIVNGQFNEGFGEEYRAYEIADKLYFHEQYSKKIQFKQQPDCIHYARIEHSGTFPHIDGSRTAINYYINTTNNLTFFWELKNNSHAPNAQQGDSLVVKYDTRQLRIASCFRALPNEAYVLSTNEIHSVGRSQIAATRELFRWIWNDLTIEEVLENIILIND